MKQGGDVPLAHIDNIDVLRSWPVRQVAYVVSKAHKPAAPQRVPDMESPTSAIVFRRTRLDVDTLVETPKHTATAPRRCTAACCNGNATP